MLRYAHAFLLQTTTTALANGRSKIEERLARWLLMADDRLDGEELPLTHEFLGLMLGTYRPASRKPSRRSKRKVSSLPAAAASPSSIARAWRKDPTAPTCRLEE